MSLSPLQLCGPGLPTWMPLAQRCLIAGGDQVVILQSVAAGMAAGVVFQFRHIWFGKCHSGGSEL